jgi:hypothetical protein
MSRSTHTPEKDEINKKKRDEGKCEERKQREKHGEKKMKK